MIPLERTTLEKVMYDYAQRYPNLEFRFDDGLASDFCYVTVQYIDRERRKIYVYRFTTTSADGPRERYEREMEKTITKLTLEVLK